MRQKSSRSIIKVRLPRISNNGRWLLIFQDSSVILPTITSFYVTADVGLDKIYCREKHDVF